MPRPHNACKYKLRIIGKWSPNVKLMAMGENDEQMMIGLLAPEMGSFQKCSFIVLLVCLVLQDIPREVS